MREICTCSLGGGRRLARKRASSDPTDREVKGPNSKERQVGRGTR